MEDGLKKKKNLKVSALEWTPRILRRAADAEKVNLSNRRRDACEEKGNGDKPSKGVLEIKPFPSMSSSAEKPKLRGLFTGEGGKILKEVLEQSKPIEDKYLKAAVESSMFKISEGNGRMEETRKGKKRILFKMSSNDLHRISRSEDRLLTVILAPRNHFFEMVSIQNVLIGCGKDNQGNSIRYFFSLRRKDIYPSWKKVCDVISPKILHPDADSRKSAIQMNTNRSVWPEGKPKKDEIYFNKALCKEYLCNKSIVSSGGICCYRLDVLGFKRENGEESPGLQLRLKQEDATHIRKMNTKNFRVRLLNDLAAESGVGLDRIKKHVRTFPGLEVQLPKDEYKSIKEGHTICTIVLSNMNLERIHSRFCGKKSSKTRCAPILKALITQKSVGCVGFLKGMLKINTFERLKDAAKVASPGAYNPQHVMGQPRSYSAEELMSRLQRSNSDFCNDTETVLRSGKTKRTYFSVIQWCFSCASAPGRASGRLMENFYRNFPVDSLEVIKPLSQVKPASIIKTDENPDIKHNNQKMSAIGGPSIRENPIRPREPGPQRQVKKMKTGRENNRLHIQEPWFSEILSGRKTVEGRSGSDKKFAGWIGKSIVITNGESESSVEVTNVTHYSNLQEYLRSEGWERVAPHTGSIDGALEAYLNVKMRGGAQVFGEKRVEEKGGICAIELSITSERENVWKHNSLKKEKDEGLEIKTKHIDTKEKESIKKVSSLQSPIPVIKRKKTVSLGLIPWFRSQVGSNEFYVILLQSQEVVDGQLQFAYNLLSREIIQRSKKKRKQIRTEIENIASWVSTKLGERKNFNTINLYDCDSIEESDKSVSIWEIYFKMESSEIPKTHFEGTGMRAVMLSLSKIMKLVEIESQLDSDVFFGKVLRRAIPFLSRMAFSWEACLK